MEKKQQPAQAIFNLQSIETISRHSYNNKSGVPGLIKKATLEPLDSSRWPTASLYSSAITPCSCKNSATKRRWQYVSTGQKQTRPITFPELTSDHNLLKAASLTYDCSSSLKARAHRGHHSSGGLPFQLRRYWLNKSHPGASSGTHLAPTITLSNLYSICD